MKNKKVKAMLLDFSISLFSVFIGFVVAGIFMACVGVDPLEAYSALWQGAFGSLPALTTTLTKTVPTIFTGLAVAIAFKCTVFNIGVEGQFMLGAMFAGIAGIYIEFLPSVLHIPVVLMAGMLGGMVWAFMPAMLKLKFNVNVVIATIMFNYIGQYLVQYLIRVPFRGNEASLTTLPLQETALLPALLERPYNLNLGFVVAILAVIFCYILLNKTTVGYELKAVGLNSHASRTNGINVEKNMVLALIISGMLSGLGGAVEVAGTLGKVYNGFSTGYGFSGIPIALMARNNPIAIIFTSLLIGTMRSGSLLMQTKGISPQIINIVQGLIIVFLCAENVIRYYIKNRERNKTYA